MAHVGTLAQAVPQGGRADEVGVAFGGVDRHPEKEFLEQWTQFSRGCLNAICHPASLGPTGRAI
ncbi:hypothetical protein HerbRD11066_52170 [Herbidospora sp. RD11066]